LLLIAILVLNLSRLIDSIQYSFKFIYLFLFKQ